jgi:hypothetical protein
MDDRFRPVREESEKITLIAIKNHQFQINRGYMQNNLG